MVLIIDKNKNRCYNIDTVKEGANKVNEWIKIDEQQAEGSWMGYEDFISADGKTIKRVWYDGCEEDWEA